MPWEVQRDASACSASKPFAVKKKGGALVACHSSHASALRHLRALYANDASAELLTEIDRQIAVAETKRGSDVVAGLTRRV